MLAIAGLMLTLLSACVGNVPGTIGVPGTRLPGSPVTSSETIGTGSVRVGLLLPFGAEGNAATIARVFRNSATLALEEVNNADITLLVKDTKGTPQGAANAARQALGEGAELLLGPVFADSVRAAGEVARRANRPLIGFSSDPGVATQGVYLLSFLTGNDVRRIIDHAGQRGKRSFVALVPDNAFGLVAEAAFRETVPRIGGRVLAIQRYSALPGDAAATQADVEAKAALLAGSSRSVDAIFIPQGGVAPVAVSVLADQGVNTGTARILGTGIWDDQHILASSSLTGAIFAAPEKAGFDAFAANYQARFGSPPPRTASLAFDATILAAGLVRGAGERRFDRDVLTNPDGFLGTDGIFRLKANGLNERGLAIYEVANGSARRIDSAPQVF